MMITDSDNARQNTNLVVIAIVIALPLLYTMFFHRRRGEAEEHLPPGPKPRFFTGNLHQFPRSEAWRTYAEWAKRSGTRSPFSYGRQHLNIVVGPVEYIGYLAFSKL